MKPRNRRNPCTKSCPRVCLTGCDVVKSPYFVKVCAKHRGIPKDGCRECCQPNTREDGINLHVSDVGQCILGTIVFVGPGLVGTDYFLYQIEYLAARGFRVISITQRGTGESDKPYPVADYDVYADDLRQVLDCLDVKDVTLVGHSASAGTVLHYAARHECCRVGRIVMVSPPAPDATFKVPDAAIDGLIAGQLADYPAAMAQFTGLLFTPDVPSPETFGFVHRELLETPLYSAVQHFEYVLRTAPLSNILLNDTPKVCVPTTIIMGVGDVLTPFPIALQYQALIPGSTVVPFLTSGHLPFITEKQFFNDTIFQIASTGKCAGGTCTDVGCAKLVNWDVKTGPVFAY